MNQIRIQCPEHPSQAIGLLDLNPKAEKLGYCFQCIAERSAQGTLPKILDSFDDYMKNTSEFYEKCRERVNSAGDPPVEYFNELSKKAERIEKLSKHVDQERNKMKEKFEDIREIMLKNINQKEKECAELLEKEVLDLSEAYEECEKLLKTGWPNQSHIEEIYPSHNSLEKKLGNIENLGQLQDFIAGTNEDMKRIELYMNEETGLEKKIAQMERFVDCFKELEASPPTLESKIFNSSPEGLENLINEQLKGFLQEEVTVKNSLEPKLKKSSFVSNIINKEQFKILQGWLPKKYNSNFKLLYKSSVDGVGHEIFHKKCDGQGATVMLIKCKFEGTNYMRIIGGFLDQSWHSNGHWSSSDQAFLFYLDSKYNSIKCPIIETECRNAFYGDRHRGPAFGQGHDMHVCGGIEGATLKEKSYSGSASLSPNGRDSFNIEDIEVFQVSEK